jgi:hypothetical protein
MARPFAFTVGILVVLSGCAYTTAKPVPFADRDTKGFRVYEPKPLLLVTDKTTQVVFVPNFDRGYAVRFGAFLSKNDITLKTTEGALTEVTSHIDTTAALTLLQTLGQTALQQVDKLKALGASVDGKIPGMEGVYDFEFDVAGRFTGLKRLMPK